MKKTLRQALCSLLVLVMTISALLGTTYAWFTDMVTSSGNVIATGTLRAKMEWSDDLSTWNDASGGTIFNNELWEPGFTEVKYIRISNIGQLNFKWQLFIEEEGKLTELADVIEVYYVNPADTLLTKDQLLGGSSVGTISEVLANKQGIESTDAIIPGGSLTLAIAFHMDEKAGNEYQGMELCSGGFAVKLLATQEIGEEDSFGPEYDEDADWPYSKTTYSIPQSVEDKLDQNGALTEDVSIGEPEDTVSAEIPSDVKLADGATSLTLKVESVEVPFEGVVTGVGETAKSVDVHIEGVAEDNTVPMTVTLRKLFDIGLNSTSVQIFHVEDGVAVEMTQVALADLDEHNEFYYDVNSGDVVMCVASFSEYVTVEDDLNPWENGVDYSWYDGKSSPYTITTADQLAGFGRIVDGTREGYDAYDFSGDIVQLGADIDLYGTDDNGELLSFNPIGFKYPSAKDDNGNIIAKIFRGTFDGQGHTIKNLYQNGWAMGLSYSNAGGGLFAGVQNATIQNLTMQGANIVMEAVPMGTVASYAYGECTFDNINVTSSTLQNYNWDIAAIVGGVNGKHTFSNIYIDNTVTLSSLWGSFGGGIGGVIGSVYGGHNGNNDITMTNVDVACVMDVYNDVTSAYQWYAYRFCGMLIGNTNQPGADGKNAYIAQADFLHCENVKVYYGDWVNYHYCQFTNQSVDWQNNYPWVRVEAGLSNPGYSNARYGHPVVDGVAVSTDNHTCTGEHKLELKYNQLYGGDQGVYGQAEHEGVTVINYVYSIQYINDNKILAETFVTDNSSAFTLSNDSNYNTAVSAAETWVESQGYNNVEFGGWVNAGSTKITEIPAGNTENIKLYPYFNSPYTARFVDQNGNVLAWCLFHSEKTDELESTRASAEVLLPMDEGFSLDHWEVHVGDNTPVEYNSGNFANYTQDVTIYPVFMYNGDVNLIPIDSDNDGDTDYYQVGGYSNPNGQALVEIPASVNGIPVLEVNGNAFASYDGVHSIIIPADITSIGDNAFAEAWGLIDSGETITIYFGGSYSDWVAKEVNFGSSWESGVSSSTRIFFLNGGKTVDVSQGYLQAKVNNSWGTKTVSWTHNTTISDSIINEYIGHCDCSVSTIGDNAHIYVDADGNTMQHNDEGTPINSAGTIIEYKRESWRDDYMLTTDFSDTYYRYRPDAAYWEGVTAN